MTFFREILGSFLLTAFVEGGVIWLVQRDRRFVYYSLLCNLLTNPALNFLLLLLFSLWGWSVYYPAVVILEILVVLLEAKIYRLLGGVSLRWSLWLSLLLNALSLFAGLVLSLLR